MLYEKHFTTGTKLRARIDSIRFSGYDPMIESEVDDIEKMLSAWSKGQANPFGFKGKPKGKNRTMLTDPIWLALCELFSLEIPKRKRSSVIVEKLRKEL